MWNASSKNKIVLCILCIVTVMCDSMMIMYYHCTIQCMRKTFMYIIWTRTSTMKVQCYFAKLLINAIQSSLINLVSSNLIPHSEQVTWPLNYAMSHLVMKRHIWFTHKTFNNIGPFLKYLFWKQYLLTFLLCSVSVSVWMFYYLLKWESFVLCSVRILFGFP